jgi:hypothetical protein
MKRGDSVQVIAHISNVTEAPCTDGKPAFWQRVI